MKEFKGKTIFIDTAPLIYFIERNPIFFERMDKVFEANENGDFGLSASVLALTELLVKPFAENDEETQAVYRKKFLGSPGFRVFEVDSECAIAAANIRAKYKFKTADSLILGTAVTSGAHYFLSNDLRLKSFKEIPVISLDDL